jgi:multidrug efflux system outer membrane protein
LLLAALGCTVGPDYRRPVVETPAAWRIADTTATAGVNAAFWEQFGDAALDSLVAAALRNNDDIAVAAGRVEEYAGALKSARAMYFPQAGIGAGAMRGRSFNSGIYLGPVASWSLALSGSWQLDLFGGLRRATEAARADLLSAREARRGVLLSVVGGVVAGYLHLRALEEELAVVKSTAASRKETYQIFTSQYDRGIISELELRQAESEYKQAVATIPPLDQGIARQDNALSVLAGRNPAAIPSGKALRELALPKVPAGLPSDVLKQRPDIRQAEQDVVAANARIGVAYSVYFPTLSLTGLLGLASTGLQNIAAEHDAIWNYAGSLDEQIFTGGSRGGQVQSARGVWRQAVARYKLAVRNGFREAEDALIDEQKSQEEIDALTDQTEALRKAAYFARLRYTNGYTSYIEVLDAERSLFDAELALAQTREQLLTAFANLYIAFGGGWKTDSTEGALAKKSPGQ